MELPDGLRKQTDLCCAHATTAVATAPLGVLSLFPLSTAQHLVAQHQRDEEELMGVISRITQQSWPQKVAQLKAKITVVETQLSAPLEGSGRGTSVLPTLFFLSSSQLSAALYGLVACAMKMSSILQELMLALRKDTRSSILCSSPSSTGATVLADYLASLLAREGQLQFAETALLPLHKPSTSTLQEADRGVASVGHTASAALPSPSEPLTLVEAVGMLEVFVKARWNCCCSAYLVEESHVLLKSV
jgi:hypothetical protein